jgi:sulfonate dioxygenase
MAPSLVETLPVREAAPTKKVSEGYNKEFFIGVSAAYDHKDETEGTKTQPPASYPNYLPVWDNEKGVKYVVSLRLRK